jgi:hypothetical protein
MAAEELEGLVTRHEIDAARAGQPPYDHYFDMLVPSNNDIWIEENQDLSCFSILNGETEDLIHICDPETFIAALLHFQRLRAADPRYADHEDSEKWLAAKWEWS